MRHKLLLYSETMMNEHTPGPWTYTECEAVIGSPHTMKGQVIGANNEYVADIFGYGSSVVPYEANARLIAAAPALLSPWQNVDSQDWEYLLSLIPDGGRGRFWKDVLHRQRNALAIAKDRPAV